MTHRLHLFAKLHASANNITYCTDGLQVERLCQQHTVVFHNTQTHTQTAMSASELNSSYYGLYVISTNMDRMAMQQQKQSQIKCVRIMVRGQSDPHLPLDCVAHIALFLYPPVKLICKIGIAKEPLNRLRSYVVKFGRHTLRAPVMGTKIHALVLQKKNTCSSSPYARPYSQSAICKLESLLKTMMKHRVARGKEWLYVNNVRELCETVMSCTSPMNSLQNTQWVPPRKTLPRSASTSTKSCASDSFESREIGESERATTFQKEKPLPSSSASQYCIVRNKDAYSHNGIPKWNIGKVLRRHANKIRVQWCNHHKRKHKFRSDETFDPSWMPSTGGYERFCATKPKTKHNVKYIPTICDFNSRQSQANILVYFQMQGNVLPDKVKHYIVTQFGTSCA